MTLEVNGASVDIGQSPRYTTIIPSIALSRGRFYGVLTVDNPLSQYSDAEGGSASSPSWAENEYERKEIALTVGYRVLPSLSVFTGLLQNETKMRFTEFTYDPLATPNWSVSFFNDIELDETGYHVGVNYTRPFDIGTLSASVAHGRMNGDFTLNDGTSGNDRSSATATGNSFSVNWSGPLTGSLSYRVGLRYVKYEFAFTTQIDIKIIEPVTALTIGISNYF